MAFLVPDFRSSNGLFQSLRGKHNHRSSGKDLFDASVYTNEDSTASFHAMVRELSEKTRVAEPTPFHHMLATLADEGRLLRLYSQNVDCIDTRLPPLATSVPLPMVKPWPKTIQVHGGLDKMVCSKCNKVSDFNPDLFMDPTPPLCGDCRAIDTVRTEHAGKRSHGIGKLRPRMVLYNEHNPDQEAIGKVSGADLNARPDALIVVGTTLKIPGMKRLVREMCKVVRDKRDGATVWLNVDPEPPGKDYEWDFVVKGPCDEVARLAAMRRWDTKEDDLGRSVTENEVLQAKEARGLQEVAVTSPSKSIKTKMLLNHVLTPASSPALEPLEPAEMQLLTEHKNAVECKKKPGPNPASKGRKIQSILGQGSFPAKTAKKPGQPKAKAGRPKKTTVPGMPTMQNHFRASKTTSTSAKPKVGKAAEVEGDARQGQHVNGTLPYKSSIPTVTPQSETVYNVTLPTHHSRLPEKTSVLPTLTDSLLNALSNNTSKHWARRSSGISSQPSDQSPSFVTPRSTPRKSKLRETNSTPSRPPYSPLTPLKISPACNITPPRPPYSPITPICSSTASPEMNSMDDTIHPTGRIPAGFEDILAPSPSTSPQNSPRV
jgi:NAD+-dependent protein deacetylase SIR2